MARLLTLGIILLSPGMAHSQETGITLSGRFLMAEADGKEPSGLANVLVYLRNRPDKEAPGNAETKSVHVTLDVNGFTPHVVAMHQDDMLIVRHEGKQAHVAHVRHPDLDSESPVLPTNRVRTFSSLSPANIPIHLSCNLHAEEHGYLFVHDNRHFAISDADGRFALADLPEGELEFQFGHERIGWVVAKPEWKKGRLRLQATAEETHQLGNIVVDRKLMRGE